MPRHIIKPNSKMISFKINELSIFSQMNANGNLNFNKLLYQHAKGN